MPAGYENEIVLAIAEGLVSDIEIATLGVSGIWHVHDVAIVVRWSVLFKTIRRAIPSSDRETRGLLSGIVRRGR